MDKIRKALGVLFVALGMYYCVLSALTLAALPDVTARWIQGSNDPDFRYDRGMFTVGIAFGALFVGSLGYFTAARCMAVVCGLRRSWLALAIVAPLLHLPWFLFRVIGNGTLEREAQAVAMRNNGVWFAVVCLAYVAMIFLNRDASSRRRALVGQTTTA